MHCPIPIPSTSDATQGNLLAEPWLRASRKPAHDFRRPRPPVAIPYRRAPTAARPQPADPGLPLASLRPFIPADQLCHCDLKRSSPAIYLAVTCRWGRIDGTRQGAKPEMAVMRHMAVRWTGSAVRWSAKIVNGLAQPTCAGTLAIARRQFCPPGRNAMNGPMMKGTTKCVWIKAHEKQALYRAGNSRPVKCRRKIGTVTGEFRRDIGIMHKARTCQFHFRPGVPGADFRNRTIAGTPVQEALFNQAGYWSLFCRARGYFIDWSQRCCVIARRLMLIIAANAGRPQGSSQNGCCYASHDP